MEFELLPYNLPLAAIRWAIIVALIAAVGLGLAFVLSLRYGPSGMTAFRRGFVSYVSDIFAMSPRRILAVALLTLKEAVRRKALIVFVVFAVLLMFAGWFMSSGNDRESLQAGVQIWFLLTAISWLLLPAVMFLACWSIPEDIRVRSLHTVVTKPIRRIEVVLGRIVGFGTVVTGIVLVMGVAGYIWIDRQVSEDVKAQLTCRVPVYGALYFKDRAGLLAESGVNTGDVWAYRSYVEGNCPARAIWIFGGIHPEDHPEGVKLESRFEAFRTIKGSDESVTEGLEAQYTLVSNLREEAFSLFRSSPAFRTFGTELVDGQFKNAAVSLNEVAETLTSGTNTLTAMDFATFVSASAIADDVLGYIGDEFSDVQEQLLSSAKAAQIMTTSSDDAALENMADAIRGLGEVLDTRSDDLLVAMPRTEVPLPPFHVTEYHEGQDQYVIPRNLSYTADYESLARYLTEVVTEWNEQNRLVSGDALADGLALQLAEETDISGLNSELFVEVLQEEIDSGALAVVDGKLTVADDQTWLKWFDQLIRADRLVSQDPAGWVLTADLFDDVRLGSQLRVEVACLNDQMFIGMARPDLFIHLPEKHFAVGYAKALFSTILMLLLVVVIGVTASCIVKGPVALFLTLGVFMIGQAFHRFMSDILAGHVPGAGMFESAVLIFQQRAPGAGVDATQQTQDVIAFFDNISTFLLRMASQLIPDFSLFSRSAAYVENGFDVPWATSLLPAVATFAGFLIPCVLLAAAFLKFRELEAK